MWAARWLAKTCRVVIASHEGAELLDDDGKPLELAEVARQLQPQSTSAVDAMFAMFGGPTSLLEHATEVTAWAEPLMNKYRGELDDAAPVEEEVTDG